jgi:hypothetical protein
MTEVTHKPWIDADVFIGENGYVTWIKNPTEKSLAPYVSAIAPIKDENLNFYQIALDVFTKATDNNTYTNPQILMSFDFKDNLHAVVFYYEFVQEEVPSFWVEAWASDGKQGPFQLAVFLMTSQAMQEGRTLWGNIPNNNPQQINPAIVRPQLNKDANTKWFNISAAQIQAAGIILQPQALALPNFKKVWLIIPNMTDPIKLDYNTNEYVDTSVSSQTDFGIPTVYKNDTFYKFSYTEKMWVLK